MADPGRPRLHLTPERGWLNDPLALTWRDDEHGGRYHLFFQHVPGAVTWAAECAWGQATSTDLLHWEVGAVALSPAADELGAWSGCLVEGRILYTSVLAADVERGRIRTALPDDRSWRSWTPGEVVLAPEDPEVRYFRDPFVVRDGGEWLMLVGAGLADGTGCAVGYRSPDLVSWAYDGVVASRPPEVAGDAVWTGSVWECPQLLRLDGGDVLVVSAADAAGARDVVAATGRLRGGRFEVESWQRLTTGAPYAASVFRDRDGRAGLVAWLRGVRGDGWAGAVSAPLLLDLVEGRVVLAPHPALRASRRDWDADAGAWELEWDGVGELSLGPPRGDAVVRLRAAGDAVEVVTGSGRLELELEHGPVRVLRDGPVLEVLVDGRLAAAAVPPGPLLPQGTGWRGWSLV